ncbi:MAG TPA: hypothetical protein VK181_09390 [Rhizobium sp.]|nr:hypothetical protein [Rhizobium sp.]
MPLFAWALVFLVASYVINALIMPKPQVQGPADEGSIDFPQEQEGTPEAVFFGDVWTTGYQTLWHGNIRTKKIKSGGKK